MNMYRYYNAFMSQLLLYAGSLGILLLSRSILWFPIYGKLLCYFTPFALMSPVIGTYTGSWFIAAVLVGKWLVAHQLTTASCVVLVRQIPSLVASWTFNQNNVLVRLSVPLVAFLIFNGYWWGSIAMVYSLLWLLPISLVMLQVNTLLARSLIASFNAHAMGTLIWLWIDALPAEMWFALTPLAFMERLLIAGGIMALSYVAEYSIGRLSVCRVWLNRLVEVA